jgi:hypothetical protein
MDFVPDSDSPPPPRRTQPRRAVRDQTREQTMTPEEEEI